MKINQLLLTVSSLTLTTALVSNTCQAGSDTMCEVTFGTGMCCASISYTFQSDVQNFYGCASRAGIELVNGVFGPRIRPAGFKRAHSRPMRQFETNTGENPRVC